jgi:hypothetical protein
VWARLAQPSALPRHAASLYQDKTSAVGDQIILCTTASKRARIDAGNMT